MLLFGEGAGLGICVVAGWYRLARGRQIGCSVAAKQHALLRVQCCVFGLDQTKRRTVFGAEGLGFLLSWRLQQPVAKADDACVGTLQPAISAVNRRHDVNNG